MSHLGGGVSFADSRQALVIPILYLLATVKPLWTLPLHICRMRKYAFCTSLLYAAALVTSSFELAVRQSMFSSIVASNKLATKSR